MYALFLKTVEIRLLNLEDVSSQENPMIKVHKPQSEKVKLNKKISGSLWWNKNYESDLK